MQKRFSDQQGPPADRARYLWLVLGTLLSLFAVNGRWDLSLAAWLSPLFFLRFMRTSRPLVGLAFVWLAQMCSTIFFLHESDLLNPVWLVPFLLFSTILVLPYLLDRLVAPRLSLGGRLLSTLVFPLSRVAGEYLISLTPFGSFLSLAYTQHDNLPLLQIISVTGIYGVSFLMAWFASVCNQIWELRFAWPRIRTITLLYSGLLVLVLLLGSLRLSFFAPSAQTVRVAGISAASSTYQRTPGPQEMMQMIRTNPSHLRALLVALDDEMLERTQTEARAGAKIVVWPEVGAQILASDKANLITRAATLARAEHIYLDMGLGVFQPPSTIYDQAILIDPEGRLLSTYNKTHPVPGLDPFGPSKNEAPVVDTSYGRLSTAICFDADFPALMQEAGSKRVDIMLLPSNDWQASDPWHSRNATFRAIENGYSLVRQATSTLAITVDYQGHVLAATDYFTTDQQTMIAYVPVKGAWTIYSVVGNLFAWLCMAGLLLLAGMGAWQALMERKQTWAVADADRSSL